MRRRISSEKQLFVRKEVGGKGRLGKVAMRMLVVRSKKRELNGEMWILCFRRESFDIAATEEKRRLYLYHGIIKPKRTQLTNGSPSAIAHAMQFCLLELRTIDECSVRSSTQDNLPSPSIRIVITAHPLAADSTA